MKSAVNVLTKGEQSNNVTLWIKEKHKTKKRLKGRRFHHLPLLTTATATTLPQHSTVLQPLLVQRGRGRQEQMDEGMNGMMGVDPLLTAYTNG